MKTTTEEDQNSLRSALQAQVGKEGKGAMKRIADAIGVSPNTLTNFKTGTSDLKPDNYEKLRIVLEEPSPYGPEISAIETIVVKRLELLIRSWRDPVEPLWVKWKSTDDFVATYLEARKQYFSSTEKD